MRNNDYFYLKEPNAWLPCWQHKLTRNGALVPLIAFFFTSVTPEPNIVIPEFNLFHACYIRDQ